DDSTLASAAIPFNAQYVAATARTAEAERIAMRFTIVSLVVDGRWITCSMTTSASSVRQAVQVLGSRLKRSEFRAASKAVPYAISRVQVGCSVLFVAWNCLGNLCPSHARSSSMRQKLAPGLSCRAAPLARYQQSGRNEKHR